MKKTALLLCLLLLAALSGCGKEPEITEPEPFEPAPVLELEKLSVEISRNGLPAERLLETARRLPDLLRTYFAQANNGQGAEIGEISVTIGASPAATAQALANGTVDLAFLPAETLALYGGEAQLLLVDAPQPGLSQNSMLPEDWNGRETSFLGDDVWMEGTFALVCAAPTEYGARLASRLQGISWEALENTPTWEELDRARWGVLKPDSLGGYRCLELWLADRYQGNTVSDLTDVTVYESYEDLFRAAARGEIDAFPIRADARMDVAEAWTLLPGRTGASGMSGFGREEPVWDEVQAVGVTPTLYTTAAAAAAGREDLSGGWFGGVLLPEVLYRLNAEEPALMETLGSAHFYPADDEALDPLRRLLTVEGVAGW